MDELYSVCFQCGGPADFKVAGDAWCHACDATAHYGYGHQSTSPEERVWEPTWLVEKARNLATIAAEKALEINEANALLRDYPGIMDDGALILWERRVSAFLGLDKAPKSAREQA